MPLCPHSTEGVRAERGCGAHRTGSVSEKLGECAKMIKSRARVALALPGSEGGVCAGGWRAASGPSWGMEWVSQGGQRRQGAHSTGEPCLLCVPKFV